jgi:hypothetical protein
MKLPIQAQPIDRKVSSTLTPLNESNGVKPQFFCPGGPSLVNCGPGKYAISDGLMSCACVPG